MNSPWWPLQTSYVTIKHNIKWWRNRYFTSIGLRPIGCLLLLIFFRFTFCCRRIWTWSSLTGVTALGSRTLRPQPIPGSWEPWSPSWSRSWRWWDPRSPTSTSLDTVWEPTSLDTPEKGYILWDKLQVQSGTTVTCQPVASYLQRFLYSPTFYWQTD